MWHLGSFRLISSFLRYFFVAARYLFHVHLKTWENATSLTAGIKIPILSVKFLKERPLGNFFTILRDGDEMAKAKRTEKRSQSSHQTASWADATVVGAPDGGLGGALSECVGNRRVETLPRAPDGEGAERGLRCEGVRP